MVKKTEAKKVFDVAKPGEAEASIGSKPMIIGHKSMASDPMMREEKKPLLPPDDEPVEEKPVALQKIITPLTEEQKVVDTAEVTDEVQGPPAIDEESLDEQQKAKKSPVVSTDEEVTAPQQHVDPKPSEAAEAQKDPEKKEEKLDPAALELERQSKLQDLIENKKYRLAIKERSNNRSKTSLILAIIFLVVCAAAYLLVDLKIVDAGIELPFRIFGKEKETVSAPQIDTPSDTQPAASPVGDTNNDSEEQVLTKPLELSVQVPDDWVFSYSDELKESLGRYSYAYTLPSGAALRFIPNGGKGGDCQPDADDIPHQAGNACATTEYLSRTEIDIDGGTRSKLFDGHVMVIEKLRVTDTAGVSKYLLCLNSFDPNNADGLEVGEPHMGFGVQECSGIANIGFMTEVAGPSHDSEAFFENTDVTEIEKALMTFELL